MSRDMPQRLPSPAQAALWGTDYLPNHHHRMHLSSPARQRCAGTTGDPDSDRRDGRMMEAHTLRTIPHCRRGRALGPSPVFLADCMRLDATTLLA